MSEVPLILLVEDNQKIAANTTMQLREERFAVNLVHSAEDALEELRSGGQPHDLLLLDVRLGGISGIELIRQLTKENLLLPTVIISGEASMTETIERSLFAYSAAFPVDIARIRATSGQGPTITIGPMQRREARDLIPEQW